VHRSKYLTFALLGLLAVAGTGAFVWYRQADQRRWTALRPGFPAIAGSTAPGLDARLTQAAAGFARWPVDRAALVDFSLLCHANGQLPEAMQGYRALLVVDPAEARWPHLLAEILTGYGRLDEALPLLQQAVTLAPAQPVLWHRLGEARLKNNQTVEAGAAFAELLRLQPGNVHALFGLARCDLQAGRLTAARARLQEAVAAQPDFPGAPSLLATVYERLGNPAAAETTRKSVRGDGRYMGMPDPLAVDLTVYGHNPYALLVAASGEVSDGRPARAVPLLERAISLDPADARLHRQLARARGRLGDLAGARAALERAVALAPTDEKIRGELVELLRATRDQPALERVIAAGLVATPESASLHFEAGLLAARAGRFDEAIPHFEFAARAQPGESAAPCELAAIYFGTGRAAAGLAVLERLLQAQPTCQPALTQLARYGLEHGDPRTGEWLKRALAAGSPTPALTELNQTYQRRFGAIP
jgi:predicted Zn-dependent protease